MSGHTVIRTYEVILPDGYKERKALMDAMIQDDPDIMTGNNGDPPEEWLQEQLIMWMTYQYDMGNLTDLVDMDAEIEQGGGQP
jgi:hypothetical protein